ncbi:LPXTG cell wall anchor domain-containing protein [Lederbergia sp. NSJ-179]|uniref:LPXTG cell wall anchor domain-containing protein n=1 Tax=Lederbergia sp. NSJ-179 TaxID=2931402 RepID=UPI0037BF24F4
MGSGSGSGNYYGNSGDGYKLPNTATNTLNGLLGGFAVVVAGLLGLFTRKKRNQAK